MGSVFRKSYTKPLPPDAGIVTKKGRRLARWRVKGQLRQHPVTKGEDGTDRVLIESPFYIAKYRDGSGVVREVSTKCKDEQAARRVLADLERKAELIRTRVITPAEDAAGKHNQSPLDGHFKAFEQRLIARQVDDKYQENTMRALRRVATDCRFATLADLHSEPFENWLIQRMGEGSSARTRNAYRESWVVFCNWCVESGRLISNPFLKLPKANVKADPRRQRRALTEDELQKLLDTTRTRPLAAKLAVNRGDRKGELDARLSDQTRSRLEREGRERALIYKTLALTGLRKSEAGSLTLGQLDLTPGNEFLQLDAANEKNRRGNAVPLRADLAADLRSWVNEKQHLSRDEAGKSNAAALTKDTPLFRIPVHLNRMLAADLKAAGIAQTDELGRVVDVHSLRVTFATLMAKGGVPQRIAQELMRHSDPRLTANVYTKLRLQDTRSALDALPAMSVAVNTTPGQPASTLAPLLAPTPCGSGHFGATPDTGEGMAKDGESGAASTGSAYPVNESGPLTTRVISGPGESESSQKVAAVGFEPTTSRL